MKTLKILFAIFTLSVMFISCETDSVNDEVGIEDIDTVGNEEDEEQTKPGNLE